MTECQKDTRYNGYLVIINNMGKPKLEIPKDVLEGYLEKGYSYAKIGSLYGVTRWPISKLVKEYGIIYNVYDANAKFDIHIFDSIDTEEKAYWLGFLFADGCVSSTQTFLQLDLAIKDKNHIIKFKKFLKDTRNDSVVIDKVVKFEGKEYTSSRYRVHNRYFHDRLVALGCVPKKSLILKFPDKSIFSKEELVYDFIRGYLDGDGCITYHHTENNLRITILGTVDFLNGVRKYLSEFNPVHKTLDNVFVICCHSKAAEQVGLKIYENATIFLERKLEKFIRFSKIYKKISLYESNDDNNIIEL